MDRIRDKIKNICKLRFDIENKPYDEEIVNDIIERINKTYYMTNNHSTYKAYNAYNMMNELNRIIDHHFSNSVCNDNCNMSLKNINFDGKCSNRNKMVNVSILDYKIDDSFNKNKFSKEKIQDELIDKYNIEKSEFTKKSLRLKQILNLKPN